MENIQSFEHDYTIPSDNRELQLTIPDFKLPQNYTIPSDNRESCITVRYNYTIPSDNRELQRGDTR